MRHVPIAEFKDKLSEIVAAAEAGEEIVITRHGRPAVKVIAFAASEEAQRAERRAILDGFAELRAAMRERGAKVTREEIIAWKNEGRP